MKKVLLSVSLAAVLLSGSLVAATSFAESSDVGMNRRQQWAETHPKRAEKMKEHHAKIQAMTPEQREAHKAEWAAKHPEQAAAMQQHKEEFKAKHPEFAAQRETWKNLPPEERKTQRQQWMKDHPEERKAIHQDWKDHRQDRHEARQERRSNRKAGSAS